MLSKEGATDKKTQGALQKAMRILQRFFTELQRDKTLRSADICYYFLSLDQRVQFDKKVKEINKLQAPKNILEIKHFEGKAKIEVTPQMAELSQNISNAIPKIDFIYTKFLKAVEETEIKQKALMDQYAWNSELFKEFAQTYENIEVFQ